MNDIYQDYVEKICTCCKNKTKDCCHIAKTEYGAKCVYYEKEKWEKKKEPKLQVTAKKYRSIMKLV